MDINATIIGQTIAFIVFVWFCMKYVWPPIMAAIEERQGKIAEGLAAAERGSHDLELAQAKAADTLKDAKAQAAEIIEQAKKRHAAVVDSAKDDARAEAEKIIISARAEIEQETNRAREELRSQVATLAVSGAEKILGRNIDASANDEIFEKLIAEL